MTALLCRREKHHTMISSVLVTFCQEANVCQEIKFEVGTPDTRLTCDKRGDC